MSMPILAKGGMKVSMGCSSGCCGVVLADYPRGEAAGPSHYRKSRPHRPFFGRLTGTTSRRRVCVHRQGELKRGTVGYVCRGPKPATVAFHDRTADRESHPHAAGFGGEEGIEQPVRIFGGDPDAAIRDTYEHLLGLVLTGS